MAFDPPDFDAACSAGSSRLTVTEGELLFVGPLTDVRVHAHPVACVLVGLDAPFDVEAAGARFTSDLVYVAPGAANALTVRGRRACVLYFEPDTCTSMALETAFGDVITDLGNHAWRGPAHQARACAMSATDAGAVLAAALPGLRAVRRTCDSRIGYLLRRIRAQGMERVSQEHAADAIGSATSTMLRLFHHEARTTFRTYKMWTGLRYALAHYARGASVSGAGLDAGFADAAHFTRRFRTIFGVTPGEVLKPLRPRARRIAPNHE